MSTSLGYFSSTLGKKVLMAVTGIILFWFVTGHMLGNLQIYLGAERLNHYAELLQANKPFLWAFRLVMLFCVSVHIIAAVQVWLRNRAARPVKYRVFNPPGLDYAARTMVWSGPILALFIGYHLLDFTVGATNPDFVRGAAYRNLDASLSRVPVAILYIVANIALGIHLFHGTWSLFQSMGWSSPRFNKWRRYLATGIATIVVVGNVSIPVAVLAGVIEFDPDAVTHEEAAE